MPGQLTAIAKLSDIPVGEARVFQAEDRKLALCNVEGTIYAIDDCCTHDNGPLGSGTLRGHAIECPRHGARFDVRDGAPSMPAAYPVKTYPVTIDNDEVFVELGNDAG